MADEGDKQGNTWPLPKFYFSVQLGDDKDVKFSEVSGLEADIKPIEYRHGDSKVFYPIKMPGLGSVTNVTMRKGIFVKDSKFWTWFSEIKMNIIKRRSVVINLLDETGDSKMVWTSPYSTILPAYMTITRSASSATRPRSCVIRIVAACVSS